MKKYLIILTLLFTGCMPVPVEKQSTAQKNSAFILETMEYVNENTIRIGKGSGFAVSSNVVVTALHNLGPEDSLKINSRMTIIHKRYRFGFDGLILVVDALPIEVPIVRFGFVPKRGTIVSATGYNPDKNRLQTLTGIVLSPEYSSILVCRGMSGGPVMSGNTAFGIVSSFCPDLGVSKFQPIDIDMLKKIIQLNPIDRTQVVPDVDEVLEEVEHIEKENKGG